MIQCIVAIIIVLAMAAVAQGADQPRLLYWGCRGTDVAQLQTSLNSVGYNCGTADGIFGAKTYNAVINLQKANKITVDGVVGTQTRRVLASLMEQPSRSGDIPRYTKELSLVATAYCPCDICNYPYGGQPTYIGLPLGPGIAAVDSNIIPMGTKLYVEGYGYAIAADQGSAIKGNRIDLCFADHQKALNYGIQNVKVYILAE
ncbi:MAG: 3D domain-containing protein [Ignavibacteriales bacterium]